MPKKLRFAPLVRVSTEAQERRGESIRTQMGQIRAYVETLDGEIPSSCWDYCGQEHATPGQERAILERLLFDSGKGLFDAVIVCDASRWSRDNMKSKIGLEQLRQSNIRFFIGGMECDLYSPEQLLFLGMSAEIGEFQARMQSLKSIQNRITRARRNIPTCGKLPYGRTFDKKTETWGLNAEKVKKIKWAAKQYLSHGRSMIEIGKILQMNVPNLWKILTKRCGSNWDIEFADKKLNVHEIVNLSIPPLLPETTIQAIKERAAANKTYNHGEIKHRYLLSRMVLCSECGYAMFGQTNKNSRRYYRHARNRKKKCQHSHWVPAEDLEQSVFERIFELYGNVDRMQEAIARVVPDSSRMGELRHQHQELSSKLSNVLSEKDRVVKAIASGTLSIAEAEEVLADIRGREDLLRGSIAAIQPQVENLPSQEVTRRRIELVSATIRRIYRNKSQMAKMTYEEKRSLLQLALGGTDREGKRLGVYVSRTDRAKKSWTFTIRGSLMELSEKDMITQPDIAAVTRSVWR
jgi:site-specific DNA recombinase